MKVTVKAFLSSLKDQLLLLQHSFLNFKILTNANLQMLLQSIPSCSIHPSSTFQIYQQSFFKLQTAIIQQEKSMQKLANDKRQLQQSLRRRRIQEFSFREQIKQLERAKKQSIIQLTNQRQTNQQLNLILIKARKSLLQFQKMLGQNKNSRKLTTILQEITESTEKSIDINGLKKRNTNMHQTPCNNQIKTSRPSSSRSSRSRSSQSVYSLHINPLQYSKFYKQTENRTPEKNLSRPNSSRKVQEKQLPSKSKPTMKITTYNLNMVYQEKRYQGKLLKGLKHGFGKLYYQNDVQYHGQFLSGKRHGYGKLFLKDELIYDGMWKQDKIQGRGKLFNRGSGGQWKQLQGQFQGGQLRRGRLMEQSGFYREIEME